MMNNKDEDLYKYINEIKTILPKNMKKDKVNRIEYLISKIHSIKSYEKKNKILKIRFDKQNSNYRSNINYIYIKSVLERCLKETINILEKNKITFEIYSFYRYLEKSQGKCHSLYPDSYFMDIGKKIINNIQKSAEDIYNVKFIEKKDIYEETTSSFSFNCIYLNDVQENIEIIKIIVHIIQYNSKNCIFKIMPISNITNKSIHLDVENSIEQKMSNLKIND